MGQPFDAPGPPGPFRPVPPPPPPPQWGPVRTTNGLAIAALVLGLIGLLACPVVGIAALVCGIMALREIDGAHGMQEGRGMAIAGLVLGAIAIVLTVAVIVFLVAVREDLDDERFDDDDPFDNEFPVPSPTLDDPPATAFDVPTTFPAPGPPATIEPLRLDGPVDVGAPPADVPPGDVRVTTIFPGIGPPVAEAGSVVVATYTIVLPDGTVAASSGTSGPLTFTVGAGQVVAGLDEGIVGVELAEHRRIVMGADKAYGAAGSTGIPPGSPLAIEVEVLSVG